MSSNTSPVPEIVYDPSLGFSPHLVLLSMIFVEQAFTTPSLASPEMLSMLDIELVCNQLPLLFQEEMANLPVFSLAKRTLWLGYFPY